MIAAGEVIDPSKAEPRFEWHWHSPVADVTGVVKANTRGEARSRIKGKLGISAQGRLPTDVAIVRVIPNADSAARLAACQISPE